VTALLLALLVTRHLTNDIIGPCNAPDPCPYVGLCVDGIAPTTTAIRIRPIGGGWTDSHEVDPLSGRIACIGIAVPRLGTPWYEAQEYNVDVNMPHLHSRARGERDALKLPGIKAVQKIGYAAR
jgi:hypothetical protein